MHKVAPMTRQEEENLISIFISQGRMTRITPEQTSEYTTACARQQRGSKILPRNIFEYGNFTFFEKFR